MANTFLCKRKFSKNATSELRVDAVQGHDSGSGVVAAFFTYVFMNVSSKSNLMKLMMNMICETVLAASNKEGIE